MTSATQRPPASRATRAASEDTAPKAGTETPAGPASTAAATATTPTRYPRAIRIAAKALPADSRRHNRTLVLQTLFREGAQSRADVARSTHLTKVTISDLVAELIAEDLIVEVGHRETARPGKPGMLIDLARESHAIVSLDLSDHLHFQGAVLDLDANVLARVDAPLDGAQGAEAVNRVTALALELVQASPVAILGVGVGTPGVVDGDGTVRTAPNLGWENQPLAELLEKQLGLPVHVMNDANAAVLAEHNYGGASDDLMIVTLGHGVGSGLIVGGTPVVGSRFASGEIGQVMVGTDLGLESPYSRDQVLEHWLSVPGLTQAIAGVDDAERERILREAGQRLGVALAPVVGALNLREVVLAGPEELVSGTLTEATYEIITRRTMYESHRELTVRSSTQGRDLILRGAAAVVLQAELGIT